MPMIMQMMPPALNRLKAEVGASFGQLELGEPHAGEHRVQPADEGVEADVVQERGQRRLAQVVLEVVDVHAALEREGDEHQDGEGQHHQPGLVAHQVGQVLPNARTSAPAPARRVRGW